MAHAISAEAVTSTISNFNAEKYGHVRLPWWPVEVQRTIARHLDRETAHVDALIASKRKMIELLDEKWQSIMHDAVSGFYERVSGKRRRTALSWLGSLPAHWREVQLKLVARLGTGHTPSRSHAEWWVDPTIPWITTGEVAQMRGDRIEYVTGTREKISEVGLANSSAEIHPAGTVVLCRTASAGYSAIMGRAMATSQDFATWTCGPLLHPRFLLLCLRVMRQDLLGRLAMGSTHKTIYMPDIESIAVPLPPIKEQEKVVADVYGEQGTLDACAERLRAQIDLLKERRQALITAAVTGELEIRGAA
jgi:type I restriction enzyme S subunit